MMLVATAQKACLLRHCWLPSLAVVVGGLSGCASLSREECLAANWRLIGYEDGSRGHLPDYLAEHRKACAEYGVVPELDAYQKGHEKGIHRYCRPANGYYLGRQGYSYTGVCSAEDESEFLRAFRQGQHVYETERQLRRLEQEIWQLREHVEQLNKDKKEKTLP